MLHQGVVVPKIVLWLLFLIGVEWGRVRVGVRVITFVHHTRHITII
jgi:hypothetical protein